MLHKGVCRSCPNFQKITFSNKVKHQYEFGYCTLERSSYRSYSREGMMYLEDRKERFYNTKFVPPDACPSELEKLLDLRDEEGIFLKSKEFKIKKECILETTDPYIVDKIKREEKIYKKS